MILDFTGGFLSLIQLCLDCVDLNDFTGIYKNWPKLVLAAVTLIFNIFGMVQHYILYPMEYRRSIRASIRMSLKSMPDSPTETNIMTALRSIDIDHSSYGGSDDDVADNNETKILFPLQEMNEKDVMDDGDDYLVVSTMEEP